MEKSDGNDRIEEIALSYLPQRLLEAVRRTLGLYKSGISEIRLREGCPVYITCSDKNISCGIVATSDDLNKTVRTLCGNSLYCHSETIKEGYISTSCGIRVGVCGRAITEGGRIISVTDLTSVAIRIPHRVPGAADSISRLACDGGILLYSPPGVGKTTALRELTARLSGKPYCIRVAVVDTRHEICGALAGELCFDALSGYPRAKGIETALRTLSPQLIICDEIGSREDADAIRDCAGAGVPVAASAHAGSVEELMKKPYISPLLDAGIFKWITEVKRSENRLIFNPTCLERADALC